MMQILFSLVLAVAAAGGFAQATTSSKSTTTTKTATTTTIVLTVTPTAKHQTVDGFGVSCAFGQAGLLSGTGGLSAANQSAVLDLLFNTTSGAGISILRNGIGSEVSASGGFASIQPYDPGLNTTPAVYVPPPEQDSYQIPLTKAAIARGLVHVYANAWSADGYMKTNANDDYGGYLCGVTGTLNTKNCTTGDWRQAYANKLVQYVKDYQNQGINISYLGFLNEADLTIDLDYASMESSGQQAADILGVLYPILKASGLSTKLACCDTCSWTRGNSFIQSIKAAGMESYLGIATTHPYCNFPNSIYDTKLPVWQTEWCDLRSVVTTVFYNATTAGEGIVWALRIQEGFVLYNNSAFFAWWGVAPPETVGNQALITVNGDSYTTTKRLWAYGQFSRFVRPGAVRIGSTPSNGSLTSSAFVNSDGSLAVQVINNGLVDVVALLKGTVAKVPARTYLTNNAHDLTPGNSSLSDTRPMATVPAKSMLSFVLAKGQWTGA